jgi:hypothetical protein
MLLPWIENDSVTGLANKYFIGIIQTISETIFMAGESFETGLKLIPLMNI